MAALGAGASAGQAAGVVLVAAGVLLVRGVRGSRSAPRDLALALFVALCIGGYTLVDNEGVEHAAPAPLPVADADGRRAAVRAAGAADARPRRASAPSCARKRSSTRAAAFGAYALVLAALTLAPAAAVAAVRESSVVMAALLARVTLKEAVGPARLAGAVAVTCGVALIALS